MSPAAIRMVTPPLDTATISSSTPPSNAPPTFPFFLQADSPIVSGYLPDVGIPITDVLHGEPSYTFHDVMCAGDRVRVTRRVVDVYDKKGGALEFVAFESEVRHADSGALVAVGRQVMIWRHR